MPRYSLTVMLAGIALFGSIAWYLLSPAYSMSQLREAALAGNTAELEERVDFPAFRESLKSELRAQLEAEMDKRKGRDEPLLALGGLIALGMIDPLIDGLATPEGLEALLAHGRFEKGGAGRSAGDQPPVKWSFEHKGLDTFLATVPSGSRKDAPSLVFERDGLGWTLVGITFDGETYGETDEAAP